MYITGSNAYMLSSEIATLISGRYVRIEMLPLSLRNMESTGSESELARKYVDYLENSSFHTLELAGQPKEIRDYLDGLFNTIVVMIYLKERKSMMR